MSSPAASDAGARPKKDEQITFRFCSECSNMLYPKEDEVNHKLMFECRTCAYTEEAASTCIFRHNLSNTAGETAGVTQDVGSDPTGPTEGMFDWDEDAEMEYYEHLDEYIDESSEESLVDSLTSAGMILDEGELLWYAGETRRQLELEQDEDDDDDDDDDDDEEDHKEDHEIYNDDQPMDGSSALPICL
ncbi:hypothetical protein NKR19_g2117 [Coniochaeta hoffmannii]|uniref:DNA-directed RNA polymerase II subunit RPB9-like zinc ribbon domain-containing protein n=1 Tax=Coniochaeta hoffmannii TaxID=91930 RepID=A0AA38VSH3_9PEZI|nr:hypothetical protein NKR19_g2117 [Coniochaeta hoffmannii]